jgi:hypothetical protein
MKNLTCLAVLFLGILITSCSVQKRHYLKGNYIDWTHNEQKASSPEKLSPAGNSSPGIALKKHFNRAPEEKIALPETTNENIVIKKKITVPAVV